MSFFKAYDMRGRFEVDFTLDTVYRVGRWLPHILSATRILIGRDARLSSPAIREALCKGLIESGCSIDDMGLSTTPMVYFFTAKEHYDASVQITASHNPADHNGMKVSKRGALPVGYDTGLAELQRRVESGELPPRAETQGTCRAVDYREAFVAWLRTYKQDLSNLTVVVDGSDGVAGILVPDLLGPQFSYLNMVPDGRFPHHAPNPLEVENCAQLSACVVEKKADIGVIFDGDADRVMFVDEQGRFIQPDYLIPVIARYFLEKEPGATVIHDIRTSRGVIETLREAGAHPLIGKVGHAYAKVLLRTSGAVCGGELAGHYYFRDFFCCDSGELAALIVLNAVAHAKRNGITLSQLIAPIMRYANSGEINFTITDKAAAIAALDPILKQFGTICAESTLDGRRVEYADGWVNIRQSNTEPYLRLIAEATTPELLALRLDRMRAILTPFTL